MASRSSARSCTSWPLVEVACFFDCSRLALRLSTRPAAMRESFSKRARQLAGLLADLTVEIGQLRLQLLDARMAVEQRRGLLGQLRAQRDPLLRQPADQFGIEHFRGLDRLAALKHLADQPRLGFGIGFQRAGVVQLGIQFAHLLVRQRGVVGADEQAGLGAKILDPRFGIRDLLAQIVDFTRQPLPGRLGLLLPRVLLQHQIAFGDRVGDASPPAPDRATGIRSRSRAIYPPRMP